MTPISANATSEASGKTEDTTYLVKGAGVTLYCGKGQSMIDWINYFLERGIIPTIEKVKEGDDAL